LPWIDATRVSARVNTSPSTSVLESGIAKMRSAANRPSASSVPTTGLLQRAQRLAREHAPLELAVQALGRRRQQRPDRVLAAGRLEQLHRAERVGGAREQRVEQRGLLAAGAVRHAHERVQQRASDPDAALATSVPRHDTAHAIPTYTTVSTL
jgi:hypothetical protein